MWSREKLLTGMSSVVPPQDEVTVCEVDGVLRTSSSPITCPLASSSFASFASTHVLRRRSLRLNHAPAQSLSFPHAKGSSFSLCLPGQSSSVGSSSTAQARTCLCLSVPGRALSLCRPQ